MIYFFKLTDSNLKNALEFLAPKTRQMKTNKKKGVCGNKDCY